MGEYIRYLSLLLSIISVVTLAGCYRFWYKPLQRAHEKLQLQSDQLLEAGKKSDELVKNYDELFERCDRFDTGLSQIEREVLPELERRASTQERRANEYLAMIRGIQGERDTWRELYLSCSSGAAAAQSMMFQEVERLTRLFFVATGKMPPSNPVFAEIKQAFVSEHGGAIEEFRQDGGSAGTAERHQREAAELARIEAGPPAPAPEDLKPVNE